MRLSRKAGVDETKDWIERSQSQDVVDRGADRLAERRQPAEGDVRQGAAAVADGCSCSTNRPRASTSAPRIRSTRSSSSAAAEGVATLVASTDTDELVRLCDRVDRPGRRSRRRHAAGGRDHSRTNRAHATADLGEGSMIKRLGLDKYSALYLWGFFIDRVHDHSKDARSSAATSAKTILIENVIVGVLAIAFLIPLTTGTYDLSIGADDDDVAGDHATRSPRTRSPAGRRRCSSALFACAVAGFISGFVVVKLRVNSFIATLGMSQIITAFVLLHVRADDQRRAHQGLPEDRHSRCCSACRCSATTSARSRSSSGSCSSTRRSVVTCSPPAATPRRRASPASPPTASCGSHSWRRACRRLRRRRVLAGRSAPTDRTSAPATCSRRSPPCSSAPRRSRAAPTCGGR